MVPARSADGRAVAQEPAASARSRGRASPRRGRAAPRPRPCRRAHRCAATARGRSNTSRAAMKACATSGVGRRVSPASRTAMAGPPRLTTALVRPSAMISRRRLWLVDAGGEALAQQRREIAGEPALELRLVGHPALQEVVLQGDLGVAQQHRQLRPRQAAPGAARAPAAPCRRAAPRARGRAGRAPPARASAARSRASSRALRRSARLSASDCW